MLSYNQLIGLGFTASERVKVKEESFSYQVFTLQKKDSYIEVTTEFNHNDVAEKQLLDYRIKNLKPLKCNKRLITDLKQLM